jgi:hypothetical protein
LDVLLSNFISPLGLGGNFEAFAKLQLSMAKFFASREDSKLTF